MRKYGVLVVQVVFLCILLLSGCLKGEQDVNGIEEAESFDEEVNQEEAVEEPENEGADSEEDAAPGIDVDSEGETVERQLYLIDADGMVVPQTLQLPRADSKAVATQVLEYLVVDGPITNVLPNGFQAVIPAGTEILGLNLLDDGTLIVDVSEEFTSYEAEDEVKIIEAMTHTLTQFENVERIKLWINGVSQSTMPVGGTPIANGYSKANGINVYMEELPNFTYSKVVTMHYPKQHNGSNYFVPVTQYLNDKANETYPLMVQALLEGAALDVFAIDIFNDGTSLVQEPIIVDGVLQLEFNEHILKEKSDAIIADEVIETLAQNFSHDDNITAIEVKVENQEHIKNEHGEAYTEPVSVQVSPPVKM